MKKYITLLENNSKPKEVVAKPIQPKSDTRPLVHISETYEPNPVVRKIVRSVMEKKTPQPPKPQNPVAKNANATIGGGGAGKHKDKKKDAKQGVQKHKGQQLDEYFEKEKPTDGELLLLMKKYRLAKISGKPLASVMRQSDIHKLIDAEKDGRIEALKYRDSIEEEQYDSKGDFKRRELEHELGHETRSGAVYIDGKYWKTFDTYEQAKNIARSLERKGKRAVARMLESYGSPSPAQKRFNRALEKQRNSPENKADRESHRKRLDAIMPPPKKDTPVGEKMRTPFAGAAVGQKEGPAGQLKAMDPKGYPKGKLVGGALEEGKVCPQCGSSKCSCPPGKCKCKPVAGFKPKMSEDKDPCWKNYKMVGTKKKGGKTVPNCVPKESRVGEAQNAAQQAAIAIAKKKKKDVAEGILQKAVGQLVRGKPTPIRGEPWGVADTSKVVTPPVPPVYAGVNLGGQEMKKLAVGDKVKWIDQKAEIVAIHPDGKHCRVHIPSSWGGETKDVRISDIKRFGSVKEGGPFSYGKPPRKGSVADLAAKHRKEQDRKTPPIEPKDQMVGNAKVTKNTKESQLDELDRPSGKLYIIITTDNAGAPHVFGDFGSFPQDVMHKIAKRGTRDKSGAKTKLKIDFLFDDFRTTIQQLRTIFRDLDFIGAEAAEFIIKSSALRSDQGEEVKHLRDYIQAGDDRRMKMYQAPEDDEEEGEPTGGNILRIDPETGAARRVVGVKPQTQMGGHAVAQPTTFKYTLLKTELMPKLRDMGFKFDGNQIILRADQRDKLKNMLGAQFQSVFGQKGTFKEGGEKYKIKSIGSDVDKESGERRDYYISPSTGKKVYKAGVKKGDHENPNSGDVKKQVKEFKMSLPPAGSSPEEAAAFAADQQARSQAMYQQQQQQQTQQATTTPPANVSYGPEYLEKAANPNRTGRFMMSVDDAKIALDWLAKNPNYKPPTAQPSAQSSAPATGSGLSREYLEKAANPNRTGRFMISVDQAQQELNQMKESAYASFKPKAFARAIMKEFGLKE